LEITFPGDDLWLGSLIINIAEVSRVKGSHLEAANNRERRWTDRQSVIDDTDTDRYAH
jgi:hypothetical protein